ncbi:hypothetical protein A2Z22_01495 [Candidatus Woesebacteria bacterium RBG_16_34_12]|uniref:Nudix hydrolase domain-containing protein n=1 Tax=Candidatus Woesebacteria bacterium RBG_16_34_12 TaxID=1802480 RepID=A0A1F7XA16_9BACT|nr:MAG: hypothetical protein A2Z22_01495 [Candidatus Woesebacteria bacterium RBG_16_34_12]
MGKIGIRAVTILIKDDKIFLMYRKHNGKEYWVFPGGGVEENESVENAVIREIEEEASIKSEIIKLLYSHIYPDIGDKHYFYLCRYISGTPKLGNFNELKTMENENQTYKPTWINIKKLPNLLLYPLEIRDWLIEDLRNNFQDCPRSKTLNSENLRQEL